MEKGIIVGLNINHHKEFDKSMKELVSLAHACNIEIVSEITQNKDKPTIQYYIGKGKLEEIKYEIESLEPDLVIFDNELSPSQIRNLEKELEIKVIDRTVLILDIFARRAKTTEAKLQVELAQSEYMLPRVIGMYQSLSRQKSGTGSKGPGEQKLELDRRLLREKVTQLKKELKGIVDIRRNQRKNRQSGHIPVVSLIGYTNSGKSTLMNTFIDLSKNSSTEHVFKKDMLFATLETKTTRVSISDSINFLLTDTVGFIKKLPHHLIEAFKSTLEEINEADLLLHVIDISNPDYQSQITAVNEVIKEINANEIPIIHVFNKIDLIEMIPYVEYPNSVFISAERKDHIDKLIDKINQELEKNSKLVDLLIPYNKGDLFHSLKTSKTIIQSEYQENGIFLQVKLTPYDIEKFQSYILKK